MAFFLTSRKPKEAIEMSARSSHISTTAQALTSSGKHAVTSPNRPAATSTNKREMTPASKQVVTSPSHSLQILFTTRDTCHRCKNTVYQVERVGPINETIFHKPCFKCFSCRQQLTLRTYFTNQDNLSDKEVYCQKHWPRSFYHGYDDQAMGFRRPLHAPSRPYWRTIRGTGEVPSIDADAFHIVSDLGAQKVYSGAYRQAYGKHHYPALNVQETKQKLSRFQRQLEEIQTVEEDKLLQEFQAMRKRQIEDLTKEIEEEWEIKSREMSKQFESEGKFKIFSSKHSAGASERERQSRDDLSRVMTTKLQARTNEVSLRLQEQEQEAASLLAAVQSQQMLELLQEKQEELTKELCEFDTPDVGIKNDVNGLTETLSASSVSTPTSVPTSITSVSTAIISVPTVIPGPHPPRCRKRDLYKDADDFRDLDQHVVEVSKSEYSSFTELVSALTAVCINELEKARAIFRWITLQDLNVLKSVNVIEQHAGNTASTGHTDPIGYNGEASGQFNGDSAAEAPLALLRRIKHGTDTYHSLYTKLCSYAGLACVQIKGRCKSRGYRPGDSIFDNKFNCTWNAVLIDGDWWPIQCNWASRFVAHDKDVHRNKEPSSVSYHYDDHYFITDPDELIHEFIATDQLWQLLEHPITLEQFETSPCVRSAFFQHALEFDRPMESVVYTDESGGADIRINVSIEFYDSVIFHCQLRAVNAVHGLEFQGTALDRFVYHGRSDGTVVFSVHVPFEGEYLFEIFTHRFDGFQPDGLTTNIALKSTCTFKIVCNELTARRKPLPDCTPGEWGLNRAARVMNVQLLTRISGGVINDVKNAAEIKFRTSRELQYKLVAIDVDNQVLSRCIEQSSDGDTLVVTVKPPAPNQYGLEIYSLNSGSLDVEESSTLVNVGKFLINCTAACNPVANPDTRLQPTKPLTREPSVKLGPSRHFSSFGLIAVSHPDWKIKKLGRGPINLHIGMTSERVKLAYHLTFEPNESCQHLVTLTEHKDIKKVEFVLMLEKDGNYLFALYAKRKEQNAESSNGTLLNVCNYMIQVSDKRGSFFKR